MMKRFFFIFVSAVALFFTNAIYAQLGLTLTQTPEECAGTGAITLNVTGAEVGKLITVQVTRTDKTFTPRTPSFTPVSATESFQVTSLEHGNYKVEIKQGTATKSEIITVANNATSIVELSGTDLTIKAGVACDGMNLYVTLQDAKKLARVRDYSLLDAAGTTVLIAPQTSNVLNVTNSLLSGATTKNFKVRVYDDCKASYVTQDVTLQVKKSSYDIYPFRSQPASCNTFEYNPKFNYYEDEKEPAVEPTYIYPITVDVVAEYDDGYPNFTYSYTIKNAEERLSGHSIIMPLYDFSKGIKKLTLTLEDACGVKFVKSSSMKDEMTIGASNYGVCNYNSLNLSPAFFYGDYTYKFIKYPAGFDLNKYEISNTVTVINSYELKSSSDSWINIGYGKTTTPAPAGEYTVEMYSCGKLIQTKSFTHKHGSITTWGTLSNGCEAGTSTGEFGLNNAVITTAKITAAPAAFVAKFGALPYNITGITERGFKLNGLPDGNYTIEMVTDCGETITRTLTAAYNAGTVTATPTIGCGVFSVNVKGSLPVSYSFLPNQGYANVSIELQKYYEDTGKWANPENPNNSGIVLQISGSYSNLDDNFLNIKSTGSA